MRKRLLKPEDLNNNFQANNNSIIFNTEKTPCKNTLNESFTSTSRQKHRTTQAVDIMMKGAMERAKKVRILIIQINGWITISLLFPLVFLKLIELSIFFAFLSSFRDTSVSLQQKFQYVFL